MHSSAAAYVCGQNTGESQGVLPGCVGKWQVGGCGFHLIVAIISVFYESEDEAGLGGLGSVSGLSVQRHLLIRPRPSNLVNWSCVVEVFYRLDFDSENHTEESQPGCMVKLLHHTKDTRRAG